MNLLSKIIQFIFETPSQKHNRIALHQTSILTKSYNLDLFNSHPKVSKNVSLYRSLLINIKDFFYNAKPNTLHKLNNDYSIQHNNQTIKLLKNNLHTGNDYSQLIFNKAHDLDIGPYDLENIFSAISILLKESESFKNNKSERYNCCRQELVLTFKDIDLIPFQHPSNSW